MRCYTAGLVLTGYQPPIGAPRAQLHSQLRSPTLIIVFPLLASGDGQARISGLCS